jgi:sigma54-dependent transcription regulator
MVVQEREGFAKVRLAWIFVIEMGRTRPAPRGYILLAESAEAVANELTRSALRRLAPGEREAKYLLNDVGLDRYNRIGVRFRSDGERLVYDGSAYRELMRRYPRSAEAAIARSRLVVD